MAMAQTNQICIVSGTHLRRIAFSFGLRRTRIYIHVFRDWVHIWGMKTIGVHFTTCTSFLRSLWKCQDLIWNNFHISFWRSIHMNKESIRFYETVRDYFNVYMKKQRCMSEHTIIAYRQTINQYLAYLTTEKKIKFENISFSDWNAVNINDFLVYISEQKKSPLQLEIRDYLRLEVF